jgi:cytochrome c2
MRRLILLLPLVLAAGCHSGEGERHREAKALIAARCGACHRVPGIATAKGDVGPPLEGFARRQIIAGRFANNRPTLIRWLMHPQAMVPGNAMPETGITQPQAALIADYLLTLDKP